MDDQLLKKTHGVCTRLGVSRVGLAKAAGTVCAITLLFGCAGYIPGEKAYWDAKVQEMCEKDGGVTVYETVELSEQEYQRLGGTYGALPIPDRRTDRSDYPYIRERSVSMIRKANPAVVRTEEVIKRRSDGKTLARSISYSRRGGDIPAGLAHQTSFTCPDYVQLSKQVFKVTGVTK